MESISPEFEWGLPAYLRSDLGQVTLPLEALVFPICKMGKRTGLEDNVHRSLA